MKDTETLIQLLTVNKISDSLYEGESQYFGSPSIYGGQLLGQSLSSAYISLNNKEKIAHSLQSFFLKPGDYNLPVQYAVEKICESKSFTLKKVNAIQNDKLIYTCLISFQLKDTNEHEFQIRKPFIFRIPELLMSQEFIYKNFKNFLPKTILKILSVERPFINKVVESERYIIKRKRIPKRNSWIKFNNSTTNQLTTSELQILISYISDFGILLTPFDRFPQLNLKDLLIPTLTHSIWFHREFNRNEYLLYNTECENINNTRSLNKGNFFSRNGKLIASFTQEGLFRVLKKAQVN